MSGLLFKDAQPAATSSPNRADIVCFVGFVGRRHTALPAGLQSWLQDQGWRLREVPVDAFDPLLNTPVPLESFEDFDRLYNWEERPPQPQAFPFSTWLGSAVQSFFRQGGARCFVVRVDDPQPYAVLSSDAPDAAKATNAAARTAQLAKLLPDFVGGGLPPARDDPTTWKGLGILLGLSEPAFVCLPDLPELIADTTLEPAGLAPIPPGPEVFVPLTDEIALPKSEVRQISPSPACTADGYLAWRKAVRHATNFIRSQRKDLQLLLALPLPALDLTQASTQNLDLASNVLGLGKPIDELDGTATAFLQLGYPWLGTVGSDTLPGGIEPPDGVLAGVLASSIPLLGVAHSIGRQPLRGVQNFYPPLAGADLRLDTPTGSPAALIHRVSLLGQTPDGPQILSDVTTSQTKAHRPACVGRLTAAILRTAHQLGDTMTFEPSGERLWQQIRSRLNRLLSDFYAAGALFGESPSEAFSVRCDATTTTQNDLDNGRVVAEVRFAPATPVGLITVVLSLREGNVTCLSAP